VTKAAVEDDFAASDDSPDIVGDSCRPRQLMTGDVGVEDDADSPLLLAAVESEELDDDDGDGGELVSGMTASCAIRLPLIDALDKESFDDALDELAMPAELGVSFHRGGSSFSAGRARQPSSTIVDASSTSLLSSSVVVKEL